MTAYYNEIDPYAAQWLRNLIAAGHIAPGVVDERDIRDVKPAELKQYTQCHFFGGIGIWSLALRRAGWPDDKPVWTGSCPCQPFSAAGKGDGFIDERHLWPHWYHLITQCEPDRIFGEQVASKDGLGWLDLVQADLEGAGYAHGAVDLCAAGVGAPHIRQRLWFVAERMGDAQRPGLERYRGHGDRSGEPGRQQADPDRSIAETGSDGGLADPKGSGQSGRCGTAGEDGTQDVHDSGSSRLADSSSQRRQQDSRSTFSNEAPNGGERRFKRQSESDNVSTGDEQIHKRAETCPTNGFWGTADWLYCRDGKWRPVSAKPQPLVDGSAESLGRVCAGTIKKIEEEINAWAMEKEIRPAQILRDLQISLGSETSRFWSVRGIPGLHEAPFLLAFMRQLTEQGWHFAKSVPLSCAETFKEEMRMLRSEHGASCAPYQHQLEGQQKREHTDALCILSSVLACHAYTAWGDAHQAYAETRLPLTKNAKSRIGRLRGYGNAINVEAAQAFIESYLTDQHLRSPTA